MKTSSWENLRAREKSIAHIKEIKILRDQNKKDEPMPDKCEWKDGKFEPCKGAIKISCMGFNMDTSEIKPPTTYLLSLIHISEPTRPY